MGALDLDYMDERDVKDVRQRLVVINGECKDCGKRVDTRSLASKTRKTINAAANRHRELVASRIGGYATRVDLVNKKIIKTAKAPLFDKEGLICRCLSVRNSEHARNFITKFYGLREVSLGDGTNKDQLGELLKVKAKDGCLKLHRIVPQITNTETVMNIEQLLGERHDIEAIDFKGVFIFRGEYEAVIDLIVDYGVDPINLPEYLVRYLSASLYAVADQTPPEPRPIGQETAVIYNTRELRETPVLLEVLEDSPNYLNILKADSLELILRVENLFNGDILILDSRSAVLI